MLLVADADLDYSDGDFGLSAFVRALLQIPGSFARFRITLAHMGSPDLSKMLEGESGITRRIPNFGFDNIEHFGGRMYDQAWLFGKADPGGSCATARGLRDAEVTALLDFMNSGGGVFATGDHGSLGHCLCSRVPRAKSMRLWMAPDGDEDAAMNGQNRNDTNQQGTEGTEFDDQSDDIPQPIDPKLYTEWAGLWRESYPHPLLCGPQGTIRILPDHPHEGQCVAPASGEADHGEYPLGVNGNPRPLPEVIAFSYVNAGKTATKEFGLPRSKKPTKAHSFGAIAAYDGHLADVGRVVTDATWHHFININLVGDSSASKTDPKHFGFLVSSTGQAHLEQIKTYYRNIGLWLSRPEQQRSMWRAILWWLVFESRVIEAVTNNPSVAAPSADLRLTWEVGGHARDVLTKSLGRCRARQLVLGIASDSIPGALRPHVDPWRPAVPNEEALPWFCSEPFIEVALGAAVLTIRREFPHVEPETFKNASPDNFDKIVGSAITKAAERARQAVSEGSAKFASLFTPSTPGRSRPR
ncbi:MAG: hypothetical protein U0Q16_20140 [Bryobacteraceae bacterium]